MPRLGEGGGGDLLKYSTSGPKAVLPCPFPHEALNPPFTMSLTSDLGTTDQCLGCSVLVPRKPSDNPCLGTGQTAGGILSLHWPDYARRLSSWGGAHVLRPQAR